MRDDEAIDIDEIEPMKLSSSEMNSMQELNYRNGDVSVHNNEHLPEPETRVEKL